MNRRENKHFLNSMKKYYKQLSKIYFDFININYNEYDFCKIFLNEKNLHNYENDIEHINKSKEKYCSRSSFVVLNKIIFIRLLDIYKQNNISKNLEANFKSEHIENLILSKNLSSLIFQNIKINSSYIKCIFEENDIYESINFQIDYIIKYHDKSMYLKNKKIIDKYKEIIKNIINIVYKYNYFSDLKILGHMYENIMDRKSKKCSGKFYTPDKVINKVFNNDIYNIDVVLNPFITVGDICCGAGYFLSESYDILKEKFVDNIKKLQKKYKNKSYFINKNGVEIKLRGEKYWTSSNIHNHILKNCLYASDIDIFALQITFIVLIFKDINCFVENLNIVKCDSLIKWENVCDLNKRNDILKVKDYLIDDIKLKRNIEFWSKDFDIIVGNPPWVSLNRKQKQLISKQNFKYYLDNYNTSLYCPNLFEYFIKRSIEKVKDGGIISLVIPESFINNIQYSRFRYDILCKYSLKKIVFNIKFPYVITDTIIITLIKSQNLNNNKIEIEYTENDKYYIDQNIYLDNKNYEFNFEEGDISNKIKEKFFVNSKKLGDISIVFTGFIGICKKMKKENIYDNEIPIYRGRNISRYVCDSNYYYEFKKDNIKGGTKDLKKLKFKEKILVRKTGNKLVAAYDENGVVVEQSLYGIIKLSNEFQYKYVLAILNSKLIDWYYKNYLITNKNSAPQIKKYKLSSIPIQNCDFKIQDRIVFLVDELILDLKRINDSYADKSKLKKSIENKNNLLNNKILDIYGIKDCDTRQYIKEYK